MKPIADITGGTVLRIPAIQSPDFVHGVSGWMLSVDGSAEFNNLTIRGQFNGTDFIINSSGMFVYSAAPALGDLLVAIAPSAGVDAFGNVYAAGLTSHGVVNLDSANAAGALNISQTVPTSTNPGTISQTESAAGNGAYAVLVSGDTHARFTVDSNGKVTWGPGNTASDTVLSRLLAGILAIPRFDQTLVDDTAAGINQTNTTGASNQGFINQVHFNGGSDALKTRVSGDTSSRFFQTAAGAMSWGPGNATQDTQLQRTAAGVLGVSTGSLAVTTAGQGLQIKEGANAKMGTATLVGGTVVVSTSAVTANSRIFLTGESSGVAPGALRVSARTAGTSFTITSNVATDTSLVAWLLIEPA